MHPPVVNAFGVRAYGNIFSDYGKCRASSSRALFKRELAGSLMREDIFAHHNAGVLAGRGRKSVIPFERLQSSCGAFAVGIFKEELLLT